MAKGHHALWERGLNRVTEDLEADAEVCCRLRLPTRGALFDVGEEDRDGPGGKLRHRKRAVPRNCDNDSLINNT